MDKKQQLTIEFALLMILIAGITGLLYLVGAEQVVDFVGVENTYFVMFFIALFGGMTSVGGTSYVASVITFVAGGADPLLIAAAAGFGTGIGDNVYFLVAKRGNRVLSDGTVKRWVESFTAWLRSHGSGVKFMAVYAYTAFTPLPNDLLTITLGLGNARKKVVIPALFLGDTTFALILAFFGNNLPFVG